MADATITALPDLSVPTLEDLLYCVDDPLGSPISSKLDLARLFGSMMPATAQGRLTLAPLNPVYMPQPATPVSTDTTGETCTFTLPHGWTTGTIVTVSATVGGLTAGTRYYLNCPSSTTCSFHTTVALAVALGTKVNLTASITAQIIPSGISTSTIYFSPFNGNRIALFDGTRWKMYAFTERSLALGTLVASTNYDVFLYDSAGTLTLELVAWTSALVRATALILQDGIALKTGALTRRYLGTIRTDSTTTTIDDAGGITTQVGGKRFVWNAYNQIERYMLERDLTSTWTYAITTWRQANAATGNKMEFVCGLPVAVRADLTVLLGTDPSITGVIGINLDSITAVPTLTDSQSFGTGVNANVRTALDCDAGPGYHYLAWMEYASGATVTVFPAYDAPRKSGMNARVWC
jgi:uncharacterized membrane protein YgdD (TMEM256/DUF423 family)